VHAAERPASVAQMREWLGIVESRVEAATALRDERYAATVMPSPPLIATGRGVGTGAGAAGAPAARSASGAAPAGGIDPADPGPALRADASRRRAEPVLSTVSALFDLAVGRRGGTAGWVNAMLAGLVVVIGAGVVLWHRQPPAPSGARAEAAMATGGGQAGPSADAAAAQAGQLDWPTLLRGLVNGADPGWSVRLDTPRTLLRVGRDSIEVQLSSSLPGYLHLLLVDAEGRRLRQLFPNPADVVHRLEADVVLKLPHEGWRMPADGPAGVAHLVAIMAPSPRDFSAAGLAPIGQGGGFDVEKALGAWQSGGARAFAGAPVDCQFQRASCEVYGARVLALEMLAR